MELVGFLERLRGCDLVVTGEGRLDEQTAYGKTMAGVASMATQAGVPVACVVGSVGEGGGAAATQHLVALEETVRPPLTLAETIAAGVAPLADAAERLARAKPWTAR